jgi:8-oxo-dGTP pyrophosphatase MutT (NUDIX family)
MNFQHFLEHVPLLVTAELPAENAHVIMAPIDRLDSIKNNGDPTSNPKTAAVMMLFYPKNELTHLVLIVRNTYKGVHSAQIAFPGGKYELEDADYMATAIRETQEEIGIALDRLKVLKPFTPLYIPPSNFMVYPFLAISNEELLFTPDPSEVAAVIELPLSVFLDEKIIVKATLSTSYSEKSTVPAFEINGHIVWGATAMMLSELKEVLKSVL